MNRSSLALRNLFAPPENAVLQHAIRCDLFARKSWNLSGQAALVLDELGNAAGASCCFLRLAPGAGGTARLVVDGGYGLESCPSGGWLLKPLEAPRPTYWIPRFPVFRTFDAHGRMLAEEPAALLGFKAAPEESSIEIAARSDATLECSVWCFPADASGFVDELERPLVLENQPIFMWASHTSCCGPADLYAYLVHGNVYENRFDSRRRRKICSELEAYALYVMLHGLEAASGKKLYGLLKRQILFSVVARQAPDGGWQHGEWTDFMESHYRFHNAAMLLLETALEEAPSSVIADALSKAAAVLSRSTDKTDIGLWFFHDSLEQSVEMTARSGIRWIPSRELGKSPATKMILNSHLDAIVTLDRYREVTGDNQYSEQVESALGATRKLLALRPVEWLYRPLYRAIRLTLLPEREARRLPVMLRAIKRLIRDYLIPQLHRVKRRFPRIVMPGGLIERHLSRLHFGVNYHSVNLMDLVRLRRRFPREDFGAVIDGAVEAVTASSLQEYWVESRQLQALGYWVEATYQLATLNPDVSYRSYLAEAMLNALDAGLGLPPSLLGAHPEVVKPAKRFPCPSPCDARIRIANLSCGGRPEILAVNPTKAAIELAWEKEPKIDLTWVSADSRSIGAGDSRLSIPPRSWLLGHTS